MPDFHKFFDSARDQVQQALGDEHHGGHHQHHSHGNHGSNDDPPIQFPENQDAPSLASTSKVVHPKLKGQPKVLGLLSDPGLNRDSIASCTTRINGRVLWAARDSQLMKNGKVQQFPIISSTASWTDCSPDGSPVLQQVPPGVDPLRTIALRAYGENTTKQAFFPVLKGQGAPPAGGRDDGTRFALWPDCPPIVSHISSDGHVTAYCYIKKAQIRGNLTAVHKDPAVSLHRIDYHSNKHGKGQQLPEVTNIIDEFWSRNDIPYGVYGHIISPDGKMAYLYGQSEQKHNTAVARVPLAHIEDRAAYEYYVNGTWTSQKPAINATGINLPHANAGGQGTYFYSPPWDCYVWIGGTKFPGAAFHITTAPAPEGPWQKPFMFWDGPNGNFGLSAYSLQAHPGLVGDRFEKGELNAIYLTYTKNDVWEKGEGSVYSTPLVYVEWE